MVSKQPGIMDLTDILDRDIEAIVALRMNAERKVSGHQRLIEKVTSVLGRPLAVYSTLTNVARGSRGISARYRIMIG